MIDRAISLIVALHQAKQLEPNLSIDERAVMFTMVNKVRYGSLMSDSPLTFATSSSNTCVQTTQYTTSVLLT